jgi:uncharacterized protein
MNIFDAPKDSIRTNSGLYINVFEPTPEMISIEDIAHALSHMPRFGGHLDVFYSVGQHSVLCARKLTDIDDKKAALLHDASEAYMMDMPSPIKARLPMYKSYEDNLMRVIANKFGFQYPLSKNVKEVDAEMLLIEWDNLVGDNGDDDFVCWTPKQTKEIFLREFKKLFVELVVV